MVGSHAKIFVKTAARQDNYLNAKQNVVNTLNKVPMVGGKLTEMLSGSKDFLRRNIIKGGTFFEDLGFVYYQVSDGNDVLAMCAALDAAKRAKGPVLVHALTVKGKGYAPAEENPGEFHGVGSFDIDKVPDPDVAPKDSFSTIFGKKLSQMADTNDKICGITAAMKYGTGLQFMYRNHRERFLMWVWRKSTPLHFPPLWQNPIWNRLCACTPHLCKGQWTSTLTMLCF